MKQVTAALLIILLIFLCSPVASAQWTGCIGCHSGTIAANEKAMKEKFQTVEAFVNAAMATTNPMMKEIQQNKEAIEAAAKELGLKDAQSLEGKPVP
jgi:ABC-type nitrate/sulfonate/bicarbonate transport system substrate-binding protein